MKMKSKTKIKINVCIALMLVLFAVLIAAVSTQRSYVYWEEEGDSGPRNRYKRTDIVIGETSEKASELTLSLSGSNGTLVPDGYGHRDPTYTESAAYMVYLYWTSIYDPETEHLPDAEGVLVVSCVSAVNENGDDVLDHFTIDITPSNSMVICDAGPLQVNIQITIPADLDYAGYVAVSDRSITFNFEFRIAYENII